MKSVVIACLSIAMLLTVNHANAKPNNAPKSAPKPSVVGDWFCKSTQDDEDARSFVSYRDDGSYFVDEVASVERFGKTIILRYRAVGTWQIKDNQYHWQEKEFDIQANDNFWEVFPNAKDRAKFDEVSQIIRLDAHHFDYSTDGYLVQCRRV